MLTLADLPERAVKNAGGKSVEAPEQFIRFSEDGINLTKELEHYENRLIGEALRESQWHYQSSGTVASSEQNDPRGKAQAKGFDPKSHGYSIQN